jgi:hypothetical protein
VKPELLKEGRVMERVKANNWYVTEYHYFEFKICEELKWSDRQSWEAGKWS